jgi:hypothetical protein
VFEQCQDCGAVGIGGIIGVVPLLITSAIASLISRKNKGFIRGIIRVIIGGIMGIREVIITGPSE